MQHTDVEGWVSFPDDDALRQDERWFKLAVDALPYTLVIYDSDLRITFINKAGIERSGYTEGELIGRTDEDLYDQDTTDVYMPAMRRALETGVHQTLEIARYTCGKFLGCQSHFIPALDGDGEVAQVISIAFDISESMRAEMLSDALNAINAAINSTLEFDEIMDRAVNESARAIGADTAVITIKEGDEWVVRYVYGVSDEIVGNRFFGGKASVAGLTEISRGVIAIDHAETDERLDQEIVGRYGIKSILALPLIAQDQVMGALVFRFKSRWMEFGQVEIDFAGKLSAAVSMALKNARLYRDLQEAYDRELHIADTLQRTLIPDIPEIGGGYKVTAVYKAAYASEGQQIGGDFYDVFRTKDGSIAVLMGDVSGKGIDVAATAVAMRDTLRAFAYHKRKVGRVLRHASAALYGRQPSGSFATVFLAVIDPETGSIRYSSAGHPPAVICRPSGEADLLECGNLPLALMEQQEFDEAEDRIEPGCRIVFYTDGLSEAGRSSRFFGIEGVRDTLCQHAHIAADELAQGLIDAASRAAGGQLRDDAAIIVLDRTM